MGAPEFYAQTLYLTAEDHADMQRKAAELRLPVSTVAAILIEKELKGELPPTPHKPPTLPPGVQRVRSTIQFRKSVWGEANMSDAQRKKLVTQLMLAFARGEITLEITVH